MGRATVLLAALIALAGPSRPTLAGEKSLFRVLAPTPPGFEALAAEQSALVDVYYGDRPLLSAMATYTPTHLEFDDPGALTEAIPDLADRQTVQRALSGGLDTNSSLVCGRGREECGVLDPRVAGIIFDRDRYRVDLFVSSAQRLQADRVVEKFLPSSDSGWSLVQNMAGNVAGSGTGSDNVSLSSFTTLAFRENRLVATASYTDVESFTIDRLYAQRDFEGRQYAGGLFRTAGRVPTFSGEHDLLGVRIASSLETRSDLPISRGTPIDLFLASRGRVDIFKEGRLMSTRFYDAGNQLLDTSALPEGAYDITIRVTENGRVREETRYFTKTSRVPPRDQPLFTLEGGRVLRRTANGLFPEDTGAFLARGGYSRRLTNTFGVDAGLAASGGERLLEAGVFQIDTIPGARQAFYEVQANAFATDAGDNGFALNGLVRYKRFNLSFDYRTVHSTADADRDRAFRLVPESRRQKGLTLLMPLRAGSLGLSTSSSERGGESRTSHSLNFRYPLLHARSGVLELRGDLSRTDGQFSTFVGVRFNFWRGNWSGSVAPGYQYSDPALALADGLRLDGAATWRDPDSRFGDTRVSTTASLGAGANRFGSALDWQHFLGRTMAAVERVEHDGSSSTNYSASFNTSMLTDGETWTFGAQNSSSSAVIIDLDGEAADTDFEVLVDGFRQGYAPAGRTTAIHLPPYRTYAVRIAPRRANFVAFQDRIEEITLYPGNVQRLTWEVADLMVVVGRVVGPSGEPLANAPVLSAHGVASSDALGYFQAEIRRPRTATGVVLDFADQRGICRSVVSEFEVKAGVAFLDTVGCRFTGTSIAQRLPVDG